MLCKIGVRWRGGTLTVSKQCKDNYGSGLIEWIQAVIWKQSDYWRCANQIRNVILVRVAQVVEEPARRVLQV